MQGVTLNPERTSATYQEWIDVNDEIKLKRLTLEDTMARYFSEVKDSLFEDQIEQNDLKSPIERKKELLSKIEGEISFLERKLKGGLGEHNVAPPSSFETEPNSPPPAPFHKPGDFVYVAQMNQAWLDEAAQIIGGNWRTVASRCKINGEYIVNSLPLGHAPIHESREMMKRIASTKMTVKDLNKVLVDSKLILAAETLTHPNTWFHK
jgi:hypothetical protein